MRILLIDAYDADDASRLVVTSATELLTNSGHVVSGLSLFNGGFVAPMTEAERVAYHNEGENMLSADVSDAATQLLEAEALLFCYPTTTYSVPFALKNWFDRVMLPGVAFRLDEQGSLQPTLQHISRIGVITTSKHGWLATLRARDGGRRLALWNLRMQCGLRCRRTFLKMHPDQIDTVKISKALSSW